MEKMIVNGKYYPLWSQFVERQAEWIGGVLQDRDMGLVTETVITGIELRPNGSDSAFFSVNGKDFNCGFDVKYGGIFGESDPIWSGFFGYGGHSWRIKKPNVT